MSVNVGLVGLGFMGMTHLSNYTKIDSANIKAVCDLNEEKLDLNKQKSQGNIDVGEMGELDEDSISKYTDYSEMILNSELDIIDICVPTNIHAKLAVDALDNDFNVMIEKPIAIDLPDAQKIVAAADASSGKCMVGQCIQFWPEYQKIREIVNSGNYGSVVVADFTRISPLPDWAWESWLLDAKKSGGAAIDLHIHDTDFINSLLGEPDAVFASGAKGSTGGIDYISTHYQYDDGPSAVTARGGWPFPSTFPFEMASTILLEEGAIEFSTLEDPTLKLHPHEGETVVPEVEEGDGWLRELEYFVDCVENDRDPELAGPAEARQSLEIVLKEVDSVASSEPVDL
ncbi:MAG: Gfo/Idh/MocA family oxidoreductase [Candidatus Bipolaricaulota bacterium]